MPVIILILPSGANHQLKTKKLPLASRRRYILVPSVRFGSQTEITPPNCNVTFAPESGHCLLVYEYSLELTLQSRTAGPGIRCRSAHPKHRCVRGSARYR